MNFSRLYQSHLTHFEFSNDRGRYGAFFCSTRKRKPWKNQRASIYLPQQTLTRIPKFMVTLNQKVHFMSVCRIGMEKRRKPAAAEKWGFLEVGNQLSFQISADFASQRARRTIAKKRKRKRRGFSFFLGEKRDINLIVLKAFVVVLLNTNRFLKG